MTGEREPESRSIAQARERTIDELTARLAREELDAEDYARRMLAVKRASALPELESLLAEPARRPSVPAPAPSAAPAVPSEYGAADDPDSERIVAILGGVSRKGSWQPCERLEVFAFLGGVELDFREAELVHDVIEVEVGALLGGVEIKVPPDINVDVEGTAFLGGFEQNAGSSSDPDAPLLRITGWAILGGVEVKVKG